MFNPYYGLFEYSATDNYTLQVGDSGVPQGRILGPFIMVSFNTEL